VPLQYYPLHGRWGKVTVDGTECAEVTAIDAEVSVNRVEVPQTGAAWKGYVAGETEGQGTLTVMKSNSWFEEKIYNFAQNPGSLPNGFSVVFTITDPHQAGITANTAQKTGPTESVTLVGCHFWNIPLGWERQGLLQRRLTFTFRGVTFTQMVPRTGTSQIPGATPPAA
jgi:hypothetical protein